MKDFLKQNLTSVQLFVLDFISATTIKWRVNNVLFHSNEKIRKLSQLSPLFNLVKSLTALSSLKTSF